MSLKFELKEGAMCISDAHYSHLRPELLNLLNNIASHALQPTQLILMGDIFDALFGSIEYTYTQNSEMITILKKISSDIEVLFLEGNHDFNIKNIFPDMRVVPLQQQPLIGSFRGVDIALAHGDFDAPFGYMLYTGIIRNPIVLKVLNYFDTKIENKIIKKIDSYLSKKDDCKEFRGFKSYIEKRKLELYNVSYFIEGHYHQNRHFDFENYSYINLAAFACNQRYFIVKSNKDNELILEENSHKEM